MKKILGILIVLSLSIGITYLLYVAVMWLLDKSSEILGRESALGDFSEKALFWLSHLGFGFVIFPTIVGLVYFILQRLWGDKFWLN